MRETRGDRWRDWSCGVFAWGTAALAFGVVLTGVGNVFLAIALFPVWMVLWALLLAVLWWPVLIALAAAGLAADAANRRRAARARASTEGGP